MKTKVFKMNNIDFNIDYRVFLPEVFVEINDDEFPIKGYLFNISWDNGNKEISITANKSFDNNEYVFGINRYNLLEFDDFVVNFGTDFKFTNETSFSGTGLRGFSCKELETILYKIIEENREDIVKEAIESNVKEVIKEMVFAGITDKNSILKVYEDVLAEIVIEDIL